MRKFKCSICGYVYDEENGIPEKDIPAGSKWEDLGDTFLCPLCKAPNKCFIEQIEELLETE